MCMCVCLYIYFFSLPINIPEIRMENNHESNHEIDLAIFFINNLAKAKL